MELTTRQDARPLVLGLLGTVFVLVLAALGGAEARAAEAPLDPGTGTLRALTPDGKTAEFPLQHTDVDIVASGFMARATVTQTFTNPYTRRIEAVYVFPLPEDAAVDDMTMHIGSRTIKGVVKERKEAQRVYDEAKAQGKTASLLTQERPNIFTQSVANILPGDVIRITITYVQYLKYEGGTMTLVFPMVVGPRYIPGASYAPDGSVTPVPGAPVAVPDADRITPPVLKPGTRSGHDIAVTVTIGAGVPFANLRSKSHEVASTMLDAKNALVRLSPLDSIPNKDFILQWDVNPARVATGLLTHNGDREGGFFTLMVVPSATPKPADVTPKEMVFVVDCSGSQMGKPIEQEKALVRHALKHLNPDDSFQILSFSVAASGLAPLPLPNTPENVRRALAYLDTLHGEGGTEMMTGIRAALDFPPDPERLRVVLFLTDGFIGNETQILAAIREKIGAARLFAFGVGSSVNRYLIENMALEGRGFPLYARPDEDATTPIAKFYDRIRNPMMTDVAIDWNGLEVRDVFPARIPDLFAGHPLLVTGRFARAGEATVHVKGRIAGEAVDLPVNVVLPTSETRNTVLKTLWARQAIEQRMQRMLQGDVPAIVQEVIDLSTRFRVLSQYTAFVAVEEKVRTNEKGDPVRVEVPVELPQDVSFEGVFGKEDDEGGAVANQAAPARGGKVYAKKATVYTGGMGYGGGAGAGGGGMGLMGAGRAAAPAPKPAAAFVSSPAIAASMSAVMAEEKAADRPADRAKTEAAMTVRLIAEGATGALTAAAVQAAGQPLVPTLRRCLATVKATGAKVPSSLRLVLKTDATGKVVSATLEGLPAGFDDSLRFCLERTFKGLRLAGAGEARILLTVN